MEEKDNSEVLIIGSGFGGSITARRLVDAGFEVTMLERGPWRNTLPTRSMGIANTAPLPQGWKLITHGFRSITLPFPGKKPLLINKTGFFEAFFGKGLWLFCTSNIGGGSHAYAGLHDRPTKQNYWDGHHPKISQKQMDHYYDDIISTLESRPVTKSDQVPNHVTLNPKNHPLDSDGQANPCIGLLLPKEPNNPRKIVDGNGVERWECMMDNNSFLGSPSGAKTTLDFAYIWPAMKGGLKVRDLCEVTSINKLPTTSNDGMRYKVTYRDHKTGRNVTHAAKHVIVAAGAINTVRLLMHSREITRGLDGMPRLGKGIGGNGDFVGFWKENSPEDLSRGLPTGGGFKARGSRYDEAYLVQVGLQGVDSYPLPKRVKNWLRHQSVIIGFGKDNANGKSEMKKGKYSIYYDRNQNPGYAEVDKWMQEVETATDTRIYSCETPISVHPIGGACLGASRQTGVIDDNGEVYGHPGLYIADAAALPSAPGGPPSMTISVWAANVADRLIEREKSSRSDGSSMHSETSV